MKTLALVTTYVFVAALVALSVGCTINQDFVESMERPAKLLFPDLQKVYEADPEKKISEVLPHLNTDGVSTNEEKRERRLRLLKEWMKNIESAKDDAMRRDPRRAGDTVRNPDRWMDRLK